MPDELPVGIWGVHKWGEFRWGGSAQGGGEPDFSAIRTSETFNLNLTNTMEYWQITKDRAQKTLAPWQQYIGNVKVNGKLPADLSALIAGFAPRVAARVVAQDEMDDAFRAVQGALLIMKTLGLRVAGMIDHQLDDEPKLAEKVVKLRRVAPKTASTILKRAGELIPIWQQANAVLAARTPAEPPMTKSIQGQAWTVAMLETLVNTGYDALLAVLNAKQEVLDDKREDLRGHDAIVDRLNKNWYGFVKEQYAPGDEVYAALDDIPTEPGTPAPEVVEIDTVTQGGEDGLHVLLHYLPDGGRHATGKKLRFGVRGVDVGTPHEVPLDLSGNALGPFVPGQVITVLTEVSNSVGTRTSAPRTITMTEPIE